MVSPLKPPVSKASRKNQERKGLRARANRVCSEAHAMPSREDYLKVWESLWRRVDSFSGALSRYETRNISAAGLRQQARDLVRGHFQEVKLALQRLGVTDATPKQLDAERQ